jgi:hypothetical protein
MVRTLIFVVGLTCAWLGLLGYAAGRDARGAPPADAPPHAADAQAAAAPAFDSARAWTHLERLIEIGPRPAGSTGIRQTRAYITRQMADLGLTVQEQPFTSETPRGPIEFVNLVVRLDGQRPEKILLTGHYDTKPFDDLTFVGANDGGSSTAFLIELARVLKDRPREFTWELVWFDGEEAFCLGWYECGKPGAPDNTYGSRHYVEAARAAGGLDSIGAMILVDMIGERGARFLRESDSTTWLKDVIWGTAAELGHGGSFPNGETPITDDHYPFLQAGVDAVDIIDIDYQPWHTAGDTIDKLSARSLEIVGEVLLAALPKIEARLGG